MLTGMKGKGRCIKLSAESHPGTATLHSQRTAPLREAHLGHFNLISGFHSDQIQGSESEMDEQYDIRKRKRTVVEPWSQSNSGPTSTEEEEICLGTVSYIPEALYRKTNHLTSDWKYR
jgi:hypothetical protein